MEPVPDLTASLRHLESFSAAERAAVPGPRRWWGGSLDVEGLALGSVQAAAAALESLTGSPGRYSMSAQLTAASFDSLGYLRISGRKAQGFVPMSGFRPTGDGWIRLHANYPHHAERLMKALRAATPDDLDRVLLSMSALEAEEAVTSAEGVAAAVRSRAEWKATAMHPAASFGPWIRFSRPSASGESPRPSSWIPSKQATRPLAGLRVLDLTRVIAGPTATRLLGALGADVLRIDPPHLPELTDAFVDSGFDKRSAVADLKDPAVLERVRGLLATADVVVTGYRQGGLDGFGFSPEGMLAARPDLVAVTLSAWGTTGPWSGRRGFDSLVQAACGIAEQCGSDDGGWRPGALPVQALDHATGYGIVAAVLALLSERLRTGLGGAAHLSLARTAEELFRLPPPGSEIPARSLAVPDLHVAESPYGPLHFAGPPLTVDGVPLQYRRTPVQYGTSALAWSS
ncbi:crotonobetainyl-CoA:carnitine CoA-transferase CaiB-like acyl-CoA transferase [Paenarthrobacter nicotinovorans]|uniref:CoA transferase n=1 Tax=Micrococcaceae TaxID=1268 RepID=UPI0008764F2E|nr:MULTISPECIES: CoA transferase [Micrococcaceae]MDR6436429.1 crotonobetainyl-CoA:carnitine CoA-transferase CaiB-like acyl-CoA transferase [Paenarthrobacter nicotinovorans]SCZ57748.1 CoA-transferase family III [Arthrobacter sp. UNCCL28]